MPITYDQAEKALKAARAKAKELGVGMSVVVIDDGANLVIAARGDGTGFLTPDIARAKAYASVAFKRATKTMAEAAQNAPMWGNIASATGSKMLVVGGAVPVMVNGQVIGAVGCSGATADQDHLCAEAGAAAITAPQTPSRRRPA